MKNEQDEIIQNDEISQPKEEIQIEETNPPVPIENSSNGISFVNNNLNGMGGIVSPQP